MSDNKQRVDAVCEKIRKGAIPYPLIRYQFTPTQIIERFEKLKTLQMTYIQSLPVPWKTYRVASYTDFIQKRLPACPFFIVHERSMYEEFNILSDFFQEHIRIK